jgi:hypothetical protein
MEIILDRSHFSGTDLDRDIVTYAEWNYLYRIQDNEPEMDDSEAWQFIADDAMDWMNTVEEENGQYYMIDDNSLYLAKYGEE